MPETYFRDHYLQIRYRVEADGQRGLRRAQLGAVHAIGKHFSLSHEPAIVAMPTGSGKTAVLMMAAFGQRARRVLVITPSVLVRNQIAEGFTSLEILRSLNVLDEECPEPKVHEVPGKLRDEAAWNALRSFDVVVGTPNSISPGTTGVAQPPPDLFDLILVDEAHHGRAPTWDALLSAFPAALQIHFTATPFRRDKQALKGAFVYTYPLTEAYKDGVFGAIRYVPVEPGGADSDAVIAQAAEEVLLADRAAGLAHLVMVRTDSRARADVLKKVYDEHTQLNLRLVHSGLSPRTVKRTIEQLRAKELDGVICVDMLGEGFDLPTLKIAAIHAPHKSLAVTLQFIGRFARTEAEEEIGEAKFIAVPAEIEVEREHLFEESAVWQRIVANLSENRVAEEIGIREHIATFEATEEPTEPDYRDIPLQALWPFNHFKIYRVNRPAEEVDIGADVDFSGPYEVVHRQTSEASAVTVFIARARTLPRWTTLDVFATIEHELFVVYHHRESNLLFVHCSRSKATSLYEFVGGCFTGGAHRILPLSMVNSVLATLSDLEFYNIGMRRRALHPNAESYRIGAGAAMQHAVSPVDGAMYHRGHVFGAGVDPEGHRENIGYSSSSKVWRNQHSLIPVLIAWARTLAWRVENFRNVVTGSGLDLLDLGVEIHTFPEEGILAVDWPQDVYVGARRLRNQGTGVEIPLLDLDLHVDYSATRGGVVRVLLSGEDLEIALNYTLSQNGPQFAPADGEAPRFVIPAAREEIPLLEYLHNNPPRIFLSDFSVIDRGQLFRAPETLEPFDPSRVEVIPWSDYGVAVQREFYMEDEERAGPSIHDHLQEHLPTLADEVVFYDHGSGEIADFITFQRSPEGVWIRFYHCKGSNGLWPGSRVADAYEVASQVVKSVIWLRGPAKILSRVNRRERERTGSYFVKGDRTLLREVLDESRQVGLRYEMILVQPGLSRGRMENNVATVLASADSFIIDHQCEPLRIWGSA